MFASVLFSFVSFINYDLFMLVRMSPLKVRVTQESFIDRKIVSGRDWNLNGSVIDFNPIVDRNVTKNLA